MAILDRMYEKKQWLDFYEYKVNGGHLSKNDIQDFQKFIDNEEYIPVVDRIKNDQSFPYPKMNILNKKNTNKKRTVFSFSREENYVLKLLSYLLLDYDSIFTPNLYSFRKNTGVKKAIFNLTTIPNIDNMYSYKVDIQDYFNSVDVSLLLPMLQELWSSETELYEFVATLLQNPYVMKENEPIVMKKGIMAGIPISPFLANVYLKDLDRYFFDNEIPYARYSDDIIVFAKSQEELENRIQIIHDMLSQNHLGINPNKVVSTSPHETWEFLGFSYQNGVIDVSDVALQKLKGKLKRKARALHRWKTNQNKPAEYAIRAYIKYFNKKFFDNPIHNEITWCKWYFPIINTDKTLHIIDQYMQECIRYIATGKYTKANYNLRYENMKALGYRSLVNEFYK